MNDPVPFFDLGSLARGEAQELHERLDRVLEQGYFIGGVLVEEFENAFSRFLGVEHVLGVGNGLDAIRLALEAYGIGPGDEVIVPAFTYYATWLAVAQVGAIPVPVDVDHTTANIDPSLAGDAITEKTRAIIAVNLYGQAAALSDLRALADRQGIVLIEDCAQSHGAKDSSLMSGSVGHAAAFSFYPTKNLGALGDAGAIATNDPEIARAVIRRRSYGQGSSKYEHVDTGWNSRLDPIQAVFLSLHLEKLPSWNKRRAEIATHYRAALADAADSSVVGPVDTTHSVWHHFVLRTADRQGARRHFDEAHIGTDIHYPYSFAEVAPMQQFLSATRTSQGFSNSERLARQVLSMPIGPWMSDSQVERVASAISTLPRDLLAR